MYCIAGMTQSVWSQSFFCGQVCNYRCLYVFINVCVCMCMCVRVCLCATQDHFDGCWCSPHQTISVVAETGRSEWRTNIGWCLSLQANFLKQCPFLTPVYPPSSSPPALSLFMLLLALHTLHPYCHNTSWGQEGYSGRETFTGVSRQESWEMEVRRLFWEEKVDREQWSRLMFSIIFSKVGYTCQSNLSSSSKASFNLLPSHTHRHNLTQLRTWGRGFCHVPMIWFVPDDLFY